MKTRKEIKALVSDWFGLDEVTAARIREKFALIAKQHNLTANQHYQSVRAKSGTSKEFWQAVHEFTWIVRDIKAGS